MRTDLDPTQGAPLNLVNCCEQEMVRRRVIPSCFQRLFSRRHRETTGGVPVPGTSRLPLDAPWSRVLKRSFDVVGALVGMVFSSPLIVVFGTLVSLESLGPVFYRQTCLGRGGRKFKILKIRSMKLDAEATGAIGWSRTTETRRLRIGSLMRSLGVDELPQFWNVLQGEMSLVGPRPERPTASFKIAECVISWRR